MDVRVTKGFELFSRGRVTKDADGFAVYSLTSTEKYRVALDPRPSCTCPDFELRQVDCKHLVACRLWLAQQNLDGADPACQADVSEPPVKYPRPSYSQDWKNYSRAQENEQAEFQRLLADLCSTIQQPPRQDKNGGKRGRPAVILADAVFAAVFKIYSTMSGRRFATDLRDAQERGYISQAIHHSSIARCLEDPATTPILTALIEASALPFNALETEFAADSSGFSACKFDRWYSEKYGRMESQHSWVKVHVMTGTTTHTVAAAIIDHKDSHDAPHFPKLVQTTAQGFTVKQASADKGYLSEENFQAVDAVGGTAYLAFKTSSTGRIGGLFEKMYHLFCLNRDEYLKHYHRRSNVESVFSAVKRLFGDFVRSKNDTAMRNEVLGKLLAYNITCLVHAIYELGLDPAFGQSPADPPAILKFPGVG